MPTVIERSSSSIDREAPVRVYTLGGSTRPCVSRSTPNGGIQLLGHRGDDWDDAPVLVEPNVTRSSAAATYELYFYGSHLHMVVLRDDGATYWVVNTLLEQVFERDDARDRARV